MKRVIIIFFSLVMMLAASIGKIAVSKGDVFVIRESEELSAKSGFELVERDTVRTSENGMVQILFKDDTVVSMGKASEFAVDEFLYEAGAGEDKQKASFKALKGAFKTITGQIGKIAPKKFNIQSRTATIGIRGTHLLGKISVEADKIACTHGAIGVTSLMGGDEIVVPAGQITTVAMGEMPTPPRKYTAAEIQELNEASGSSAKEAEEPAAAAKGEGEKEEKATDEEASAAEEEIVAEDDTAVIAESEPAVEAVSEVSKTIESVSEEQSAAVNENIVQVVEKKTGVDLGSDEPEPEPSSGMNADGYYSLTTIKNTGPIDLYGKNVSSSIDSPQCDGIWCGNSATTYSTEYSASDEKAYRSGDYIALNEAAGLGVDESTYVKPEMSFQTPWDSTYSAVTEVSTDASGYIGRSEYYDTIKGRELMSVPAGSYEGINVQYILNTETDSMYTYSWDEWWMYDNLGEFFVMTSLRNSASTAPYAHNNGMYFGTRSSMSDVPADSFLIYQLVMETGYMYEPANDQVISYVNQDAAGADIFKSRAVGNTANGNMLFMIPPQATDQGMGWGMVIGQASTGTNGEVVLSGNNFWVDPERDDAGNYYVSRAIHTVDGEVYGSELQGVGMQLYNGDSTALDTANFDGALAGPGAFENILVAGYRTDSADMINLPSAPQTTGGDLVGWTASRYLYDADGDGLREWTHLPAQITISPDRATGDISGTIVLGAMTDGVISSPDATMTIGGTGGSTSAYVSDDYFASTITASTSTLYGDMTLLNDYGGYLATAPLFPVDDVSWGYFTAEFLDSGSKELLFYHKSTWVAGTLTDSTKISELASGSAIYDFEGKVLGNIYSVTKGDFVDSINTDSSRVYIRLDFGASNIADGSIAFSTRDYPDVVWNAKIESTGSSINSSGFYTANLSEKAGSAVSIENPNPTLAAGVLYGNVYGADGTSVGGKFNLYGSFDSIYDSTYGYWYPNELMAVGVIKASTAIDLSDAVVYDKVLRGVDFSSWLSNPTVSGTYSSSLSGSYAGHVNNSNFIIGLSGDTLEYQGFGTSEYLYSWNGTSFVEGTAGVIEPGTGTLTLGSVTPSANTMMSAPTGLYTSLNIETSVNSDGANKYVVYDNTKEFFTIMEEKAGDSVDDSYYNIMIAGTESNYAGLASEADYLTYRLVGAVDLTIDPDIIETGAYTRYVTGAAEAEPMTLTVNTNNGNFISISKPHENGVGQYDLGVMFGQVHEDTYTGGAYFSGTDFFLTTNDAIRNVSYAGGAFFGSENQGMGLSSIGSVRDTHLFASFAKTDEAGLVSNPSTAPTGATTYTGRVAAIQDIFTGQLGTIENMSIDKDTGLISGGIISVGDISAGTVPSPIATIDINYGVYTDFSSYVSDDYMAVLLDSASYDSDGDGVIDTPFSYSPGNDGGVMVTSDEQAGDDYASWGYWAASFGDPSSPSTGFKVSPISTWVAGELTSTPSVIESLQASYSGKVLGFVADSSQNFEMIDTASSLVNINIDFGAADPVTGNMSFSSASTAWSMDIGSGAISSSTACFNAQLANRVGGSVTVTEGKMFGNFYGPNAETVGASFIAIGYDLYNGYGATGAIKATKQ